MGDMEAKQRELSKEEHFRMLDELVEMGCFWLHGRRDFCAQRLSRDLHLRQEEGISNHPLYQRHVDYGKDRRLSGRVATLRHRNHTLRPHPRNLRSSNPDPRLL
jgi:hypothetical protein